MRITDEIFVQFIQPKICNIEFLNEEQLTKLKDELNGIKRIKEEIETSIKGKGMSRCSSSVKKVLEDKISKAIKQNKEDILKEDENIQEILKRNIKIKLLNDMLHYVNIITQEEN